MTGIEVKKLKIAESEDVVTIASGPVIIDQDGRVLLTRDSKDSFWKFPGGTLLTDESLLACALREAKEEVGVDVTIINDQPYIMLLDKAGSSSSHKILLWHWLAKLKDEQHVDHSPEGLQFAWFTASELDETELGENVIPTIQHFLQNKS